MAPLLAALCIVYLHSGISSLVRGWLWEVQEPFVVAITVRFVASILLLALLIVIVRPHLRHDPMFLVYPVALPLSLAISYGHYNDWGRNIVLVAVVVLCFYGARTVVRGWGVYREWYRRVALAGVILLVAGGSIFPTARHALHAVKSRDFRVFRYERMEEHTTLFTAIESIYSNQYVAPVTAWQQPVLQGYPPTPFQNIGVPIIESDYTVYLENNRLIYVQTKCSPQEIGSRFILHVIPVDKSILEGREHVNGDFHFNWNGMRVIDTCIVVRDLPPYEIASFTTGQYIGGANPTGHQWITTYHVSAK